VAKVKEAEYHRPRQAAHRPQPLRDWCGDRPLPLHRRQDRTKLSPLHVAAPFLALVEAEAEGENAENVGNVADVSSQGQVELVRAQILGQVARELSERVVPAQSLQEQAEHDQAGAANGVVATGPFPRRLPSDVILGEVHQIASFQDGDHLVQ